MNSKLTEAEFFQSLCWCFNQDRNCKQCVLYARGYNENNECRRMLMDEISNRKRKALNDEEMEG